MGEPSLIKLTYTPGPRSLQISRRDIVFFVDGLEHQFPSLPAAEVVAALADSHPHTVSDDDLLDRIQTNNAVGSGKQSIYKYISEARKSIENSGLLVSVITTVRSRGYRLSKGWVVEPAEQSIPLVSNEIHGLKGMIDRCIKYVQSRPVSTNRGGLMYIEADQNLIQENFIILDRCGWQLIHAMSTPENIPHIIEIKQRLEKLMTYALFWRLGDGLTEAKWKKDYELEIQKLSKDIERKIKEVEDMPKGINAQITSI